MKKYTADPEIFSESELMFFLTLVQTKLYRCQMFTEKMIFKKYFK